jgi:uncharacterized cofD-like protein
VRVVGIGGGHGLAQTLRAARHYSDEVSAVVTVADDGGSSGRLIRDFGIPPPGDVRNCLAALSKEKELARLFQHRFQSGGLTGHTVGNLVIAALTEIEGDFARAVAAAGRIVGAAGEVHPASNQQLTLRAEAGGRIIDGQANVARSHEPIHKVFIEPSDPEANPRAVEAILSADQVVLGPGSLYTSLMATLLVPGIARAVQETRGRSVFVCNCRMQKGETDSLDAAAHVEVLVQHLGRGAVDDVIVQHPPRDRDGVPVDPGRIEAFGTRVWCADVTGASGSHDPERLARILSGLV